MSSATSTTAVRNWHFILHTQDPLTPEQENTLAGLEAFADGDVCLEQRPGVYSMFTCYMDAPSLTEAIMAALTRFDHFPGVLISNVELSEYSLDYNGMATAAVVPLSDRRPPVSPVVARKTPEVRTPPPGGFTREGLAR
ncbi:hypothetical protein [Streptomyces sp. NPDC020965]|uniref:hypothetical protein n=1 Tax=Streptomyces sp. NPDC020965 TaxID=3365105 RepID=UPI0037B4D7FE